MPIEPQKIVRLDHMEYLSNLSTINMLKNLSTYINNFLVFNEIWNFIFAIQDYLYKF